VKSHDYFTISDGVFIGTVEEGLGAYAKRNVFEAGAQAPGQVKFGFVNVQRAAKVIEETALQHLQYGTPRKLGRRAPAASSDRGLRGF